MWRSRKSSWLLPRSTWSTEYSRNRQHLRLLRNAWLTRMRRNSSCAAIWRRGENAAWSVGGASTCMERPPDPFLTLLLHEYTSYVTALSIKDFQGYALLSTLCMD